MSFAFCEPPDSGVNASANADGAAIRIASAASEKAARSRRLGKPAGKAARSYLRVRDGSHFVPVVPNDASRGGLGYFRLPGKPGALLDEGRHALLEVLGAGECVLEVGLEVELAVQVRRYD